jgi:hypothetical protein
VWRERIRCPSSINETRQCHRHVYDWLRAGVNSHRPLSHIRIRGRVPQERRVRVQAAVLQLVELLPRKVAGECACLERCVRGKSVLRKPTAVLLEACPESVCNRTVRSELEVFRQRRVVLIVRHRILNTLLKALRASANEAGNPSGDKTDGSSDRCTDGSADN